MKPKGWKGESIRHRKAALKAKRNEVAVLKSLKAYGERQGFKALTPKGEAYINDGWRKEVIYYYPDGGLERYEWLKGKYTIDVSYGMRQGFPGSNHIDVRSSDWGGSILVGGYPRALPTKTFTEKVVEEIKAKLDRGYEGKKVPWAR